MALDFSTLPFTPENKHMVGQIRQDEERAYRKKRYTQLFPFMVALDIAGLALSILTQSIPIIVVYVFVSRFLGFYANYHFIPRMKAQNERQRFEQFHKSREASGITQQQETPELSIPEPQLERLVEKHLTTANWVEKIRNAALGTATETPNIAQNDNNDKVQTSAATASETEQQDNNAAEETNRSLPDVHPHPKQTPGARKPDQSASPQGQFRDRALRGNSHSQTAQASVGR